MSKLLLCTSLALNAFCAGGIFTFPLMAPALATRLLLSQPQLTTIIIVAMMSQYPVSPFVGSIIDRHGPSICCLIAAILFAVGYGSFALEIAGTPEHTTHASQGSFYRLTLYFLLPGLGTVFSYCSSMLASSKYFPNHIGLASGCSMALFGLSPFFFTTIATTFFMDTTTGLLDVASFTRFLAITTFMVYVSGFLILRRYRWPGEALKAQNNTATSVEAAEETSPLLPSQGVEGSIDASSDPNAKELVCKFDFWLLILYCSLILGVCEMVISNIGSIALTLPPVVVAEPMPGQAFISSGSIAAFQVKLISIVNTFSRFIVGPMADFTSPISIRHAGGALSFPRKHLVSRFAFLSFAAIVLVLTFSWTDFVIYNQNQVWLLSFGTALSYSTVFTVLPSLATSLWGLRNLGRNFGILMYAPFTGTPMFSYIYASLSAAQTREEVGTCQGRHCWQTTFAIAIGTSIVALLLSFVLWRRWLGRI